MTRIDLPALKSGQDKMKRQEIKLRQLQTELARQLVRLSEYPQMEDIGFRLRAVGKVLEEQADQLLQMQAALERIAGVFGDTEDKIVKMYQEDWLIHSKSGMQTWDLTGLKEFMKDITIF